jgi:hypothetical protein
MQGMHLVDSCYLSRRPPPYIWGHCCGTESLKARSTKEAHEIQEHRRGQHRATVSAVALGAGGAQAAANRPAGPEVAPGTPGTQGHEGEQGDPGASNFIVGAGYKDVWMACEYRESIEECPEGQKAIGGGFSTFGGYDGVHDNYDLGGTNRDIQVTVSAPYFKGAYVPADAAGDLRADQWVVRGFNAGETDQVVRAWVVCADVQ